MIAKSLKQTPLKGQSYKPSRPFSALVKKIYALSKVAANEQTFHLELDIKDSGINYLAGQSVGVIPPGKRSADDDRPLKVRLYSIASVGSKTPPESIALTVKRLSYHNDENKQIAGICSNYLCDAKVGDKIKIISPTGRIMLMPQAIDTDLILIGTGTGVAPYRGFLQAAVEQKWSGNICLFLGYKTENEALYCNTLSQDISNICQTKPAMLQLALSRQEKNSKGGRMYVDEKIRKNAKYLANIIRRQNFVVYLCGIKGMETKVEKAFSEIFDSLKYNSSEQFKILKQTGRWQVEVY